MKQRSNKGFGQSKVMQMTCNKSHKSTPSTITLATYNFPQSFPSEDKFDTLMKIMIEVEELFFKHPMNNLQRVGLKEKRISFGASYEGSQEEVWRNYYFHNNHINGFPIPDFKFQISNKGEFSGYIPSDELESKVRGVLSKYRV